MTTTVAKHYEDHLGPIYSWMIGDFDLACKATESYFNEIDLKPRSTGRAIDLGCGHGVQSIPLARREFEVIGIDSCDHLLNELADNSSGLAVTAINDDLMNVANHVFGKVDAIVCMGDTLTHLESREAVRQLIDTAAGLMDAGGMLCVSLRDYVSTELAGTDRFIPVRADDDRIHSCFLEYHANHMEVYDIVFDRTESGWINSTSAYRKLRIPISEFINDVVGAGFTLSQRVDRHGMVFLAFERTR